MKTEAGRKLLKEAKVHMYSVSEVLDPFMSMRVDEDKYFASVRKKLAFMLAEKLLEDAQITVFNDPTSFGHVFRASIIATTPENMSKMVERFEEELLDRYEQERFTVTKEPWS